MSRVLNFAIFFTIAKFIENKVISHVQLSNAIQPQDKQFGKSSCKEPVNVFVSVGYSLFIELAVSVGLY